VALDQLSVLKLVTQRLDANAVPYVITGSIAMGLYAQPRMTRDIDLVVDLAPSDAERVCQMFHDAFECDPDAVGQSMWIVSAEDLVLSNLVWAKESESAQLRDVRRLAASPELDWEYITRWAADLGIASLLRDVRS
jgi:hypothetical protein